MKYLVSAAIAALLVVSTPHVASAQDLASNFKRDRNVSVRERPRPDYEAIGVKAGGFTLYPRVTASVERNDNIYATKTDEKADAIWRVKPELAVRSNWSRHALGAFASASINRYADFGSEDTEEYTVAVNGRLDVVRGSNVTGSLQYQALTEPRTSPQSPVGAVKPIEYSLVTGKVTGVKEFNRLRLTGKLSDYDYNYDDGANISGGLVEQDTRDRNEFYYGGKVEYAMSPDTALFLSVLGNNKNYDLAIAGRDSDGYVATVGANFELSEVVRGDVAVGYMKQSYDNPLYGKIDGFSGEASVEWFPTALTTVTTTAGRTIEEAVASGAPGYISNNIGLNIDHELLRNVLLSANANYRKDDYEKIDRSDKRTGAGASAAYLLNRRVGLFLTYTYLKQNSSGGDHGTSFTDNKLAASVALQF
ncbi:hypothetical protein PMI01_01825 [Caulobacter sp. AP07]|uniref:outer membrane beta-barrel protein n=1 Tax=Caulobacter sp. AP07 TaxID=1144304 RepID=UPI000271ED96|nr:outer membrane beta-barrel protein [Caulobacter sp. AP07]EJL34043.1 hypothetical protein PMI01_01825 [Caulobacter sp. AP07]